MSENADQARTRRRWVTLAEVVAVAGVIIAALGFWNSWSERRDAAAERAATSASQAREGMRADLTATVRDGGRELLIADAKHDIQSVTIAFPRALGAAPQQPVADPVINVGGFERQLLKLTDGGADDREGRLPVLVTTHWLDEDVQRGATDTYDLVWRTQGPAVSGAQADVGGAEAASARRVAGEHRPTLDHAVRRAA